MTRPYALKRLLEHGPMTPKEITACTRWTSKQVHRALELLLEGGMIHSVGNAYEAT
jgi:predicted transcriptional regulator